jgi:hypothetical protein
MSPTCLAPLTCKTCALNALCTTGPERRVSRWEHEAVLEKVQNRLDQNPDAMGVRRQKRSIRSARSSVGWEQRTSHEKLPKVATEMALNVLA